MGARCLPCEAGVAWGLTAFVIIVLFTMQVLVSISYDQSMRKWDLDSMTPMEVLPNAHDHGLTCVDYCPEHNLLATTGGEPAVKVWDADEMTLVAVLDGHKHEATQVRARPRSSCAAALPVLAAKRGAALWLSRWGASAAGVLGCFQGLLGHGGR